MIYKGKIGKGDKKLIPFQQKVSFLGTLSNRGDNLRKLAKHNAARLNTMYEEQKVGEKRKVLSSANSSGYNSTAVSRRNIVQKRPYVPQPGKVLTNANNHNISVNHNASMNAGHTNTPLRNK